MCQRGRAGAHLWAQRIRRQDGAPSAQSSPVLSCNFTPVLTTFRLLKPEQESASHADANYAEVDIDVHVAPISPGAYNYPLLFP